MSEKVPLILSEPDRQELERVYRFLGRLLCGLGPLSESTGSELLRQFPNLVPRPLRPYKSRRRKEHMNSDQQ